ncbi:MAG: threonine/serine exporter family protein [Lewinella sp.]|nr:threonine/serine exporter family protein [Lewinella sp.]
MDTLAFLERSFWFGVAALGFAILFNVPKRTLLLITLMAALGGSLKSLCLHFGDHVVLGTLAGAVFIGFASIYAAHRKHAPPFIFAIPAVIPMVPGSFAYYTMRDIILLANETDPAQFVQLLDSGLSNGFKTLFILIAIAIGVSAPMLLTRRDSAKEIRVRLLGKGGG